MANTAVEQIKERLNIIEIVGGYVELHKAGRHFKGKSPFTSEKTPSFFVSPERGMYYCFSSQKGGDMFTFIEEMEGVDFKGALKILAEKAGVELIPEDPKKRSEREAQYALLEEATKFFFIQREEHPEITAYIEARGVSGKTVHAWRIGYAPDEWRALRSYLASKKFSDDEMLRAGLIKYAEGKEPYDVFRGRVMFPIADPSGRVIAFSGRTLKKEEGVPKYVNSPETELFQKSETLYGYDKAKQGIRHYDFSLIVEGQFDVVLSHQAGYTNAVAVSGTALTLHHVGLLERLSTRVVLALDADRAGISAVKRSSEVMLRKSIDVKVAELEEGKDPADMVREDPKLLKKAIGNAQHVVEFLLRVMKSESKDSRAYKLKVREELLPLLLAIPNRIDREHFEGVVAQAVETTKDSIHYELERLSLETKREPQNNAVIEPLKQNPQGSRREELIRHLFAVREFLKEHDESLLRRINQYWEELVPETLLEAILDESPSAKSRALFMVEQYFEALSARQRSEEIESTFRELYRQTARERLAQLRTQIIEAEQGGDHEKVIGYLTETKVAEGWLQKIVDLTETVSQQKGT